MGWLDGDNKKQTAPAPATTTPAPVAETKPEPKEEGFDFSEETDTGKEVYSIYGLKGSGKTTLALSFPGKIMAISFDGKTTVVKNNFYGNDDRIKVYAGNKYLDQDNSLDSNVKTYRYTMALLEEVAAKEKPDWILFDCAEKMTVICEMVMRKKHNISAYGGIANKNVWKERKALLESLHRIALKHCNKGLIYSLYINKDEIVSEGEILVKKDVPAWTGVVLYETDFVLKTQIDYDKEKGKICTAQVWSSKNDKKLKTGTIIDVTDFKEKLFKEE